jgi:hypothetical protein
MDTLKRRVRDAAWWLRYRVQPEHRYHVVDTGLKPGFHDIVDVMLHANMALLDRYIGECGGAMDVQDKIESLRKEADYLESEGFDDQALLIYRQADCMEDALAIHLWWNLQRPIDGRADHKTDQNMLHRLIDLRLTLWT